MLVWLEESNDVNVIVSMTSLKFSSQTIWSLLSSLKYLRAVVYVHKEVELMLDMVLRYVVKMLRFQFRWWSMKASAHESSLQFPGL